MSGQAIQDIFRHRHILVLNTDLPDEEFGLETLDQFACIRKTLSMQGKLISIWFFICLMTCLQIYPCVMLKIQALVSVEALLNNFMRRAKKRIMRASSTFLISLSVMMIEI